MLRHSRNISSAILFFIAFFIGGQAHAQGIVREDAARGYYKLSTPAVSPVVYVDTANSSIVIRAAILLMEDIERVTGRKPLLVHHMPATAQSLIVIGTFNQTAIIKKWITNDKLKDTSEWRKWEGYRLQALTSPEKGIDHALVITGHDPRGTAYGVFEFSRQIGVSPWYWWADVPVKKMPTIYLKSNWRTADAPAVKYRGIFINDEAPALSGWSKEKFGGFNHRFYEKVFELMLRLKANYLWPAMWGNAFYDDDPLNIKMADEYGIVIGTSHHEPLMRAHDEWRRYGKGKWNYDSNAVKLREFWRGGMQRATNEKIVSIGMRGDGDEPMTRQTATALLERIVKDQREIISEVTGKPAEQTPQLWALYKEVQDYYDKGMRVPDDVTLLLCDDNWGNIRKLPKPGEKPRKGGYGIYYHFDYVGGPRNYKWINTNPITRVWEQMHLAWQYNARQIWIVNVGDIKPMEFPISFFLDYAWAPERIGADQLQKYTQEWCAAQFGKTYSVEIADIISKYTKYNGRRKPEMLNADTYSLENFGEAENVTRAYNDLVRRADAINSKLPAKYRDAYFQLVLHPVTASANLQNMYTAQAKNRYAYVRNWAVANRYADEVKKFYELDSLISLQYNRGIADGKWNHMMDQTHIGYTYWQQPPVQVMPEVKYVANGLPDEDIPAWKPGQPAYTVNRGHEKRFVQHENYVSIEAMNFTKAVNTTGVSWKILPDHGRTSSAITSFPAAAESQMVSNNSPHLQYEVYVADTGTFALNMYFSPTLNFHNSPSGLRCAISIDDEKPQIIAVNKEDNEVRVWEKWVGNNIIIRTSEHILLKPGKHIIKYWFVDSGLVLQKLVLHKGAVKYSYLGPPETLVK